MSVSEYLYKYRSLSTETSRNFTKAIITDGILYFATPNSLNDPFEARFAVTFDEQRSKALTEKEQYAQKYLADHMRETIGVLSLTAKYDDVLMWSHYADSHRGICIEFMAGDNSPFFGTAQPVIYRMDFPSVQAYTTSTRSAREVAVTAALTKSKQWEYEQEWRIIDRENGSGTRNFPKRLLSRIILGSGISSTHKALVTQWIAESGFDIPIWQARLAQSGYNLEFYYCE